MCGEEMNREWYMTEDEFLDVIVKAYRGRWGRDNTIPSGKGHPEDHAVNFMAFIEAFAASLDAMSDFVDSKNEEI
jgi:hypothetical protein